MAQYLLMQWHVYSSSMIECVHPIYFLPMMAICFDHYTVVYRKNDLLLLILANCGLITEKFVRALVKSFYHAAVFIAYFTAG